MQAFESAELESDGSIASTSESCKDACSACGAEPLRFGTTDADGNAVVRRHCPNCGPYARNPPVEQPDHRLVADGGQDRTIVVPPLAREDDTAVCSRCYAQLGAKGSRVITHPRVKDDELAEHIGDELIVYGWSCDCEEDIVLPAPSNETAWGKEKYTGIKLQHDGDHVARHVPVDVRELPESAGGVA